MATPGKQAKMERKRLTSAKTSFTSPFTPQWRTLPQEDMHFILKTLTEKFKTTGLEKKEVKVRQQRKRSKGQTPSTPVEVHEMCQDLPKEQTPPQNGWTNVVARRQLAIGINEVTKALERNKLKLVFVCKSVRPKHMISHLIPLSATRGVPACQVPRLSQSISEPLGLKSVLALGIRECASQEEEIFTDIVAAITPRVPPLNVSWVQEVTPKPLVNLVDEAEGTGQKRKRESDLKINTSCTLQPLTVKRIIANPEKKKKKKVN
ncbi:ribonuclease P protein subunit p38 isoform 1-T2 [Synchiropus picturatus]